ncbi:MAG: hypothetical protein PHE58_07660, partial [Candidatus Omnitrophica bacterium]|nr:hypothetical protein [Candidatus Omnitrophota bacterium]
PDIASQAEETSLLVAGNADNGVRVFFVHYNTAEVVYDPAYDNDRDVYTPVGMILSFVKRNNIIRHIKLSIGAGGKAFELAEHYDAFTIIPENWLEFGSFLFSKNLPVEAVAWNKRVLSQYPDNTDCMFNSAQYSEANGDFENALSFYNAVLAINPLDFEVLNKKARVYLKLSQVKETLSIASETLLYDHGNKGAMLIKAEALNISGRPRGALYWSNQALRADVTDRDAWMIKVLAYTQLENFEYAVLCLHRILEFDPEKKEDFLHDSGRDTSLVPPSLGYYSGIFPLLGDGGEADIYKELWRLDLYKRPGLDIEINAYMILLQGNEHVGYAEAYVGKNAVRNHYCSDLRDFEGGLGLFRRFFTRINEIAAVMCWDPAWLVITACSCYEDSPRELELYVHPVLSHFGMSAGWNTKGTREIIETSQRLAHDLKDDPSKYYYWHTPWKEFISASRPKAIGGWYVPYNKEVWHQILRDMAKIFPRRIAQIKSSYNDAVAGFDGGRFNFTMERVNAYGTPVAIMYRVDFRNTETGMFLGNVWFTVTRTQIMDLNMRKDGSVPSGFGRKAFVIVLKRIVQDYPDIETVSSYPVCTEDTDDQTIRTIMRYVSLGFDMLERKVFIENDTVFRGLVFTANIGRGSLADFIVRSENSIHPMVRKEIIMEAVDLFRRRGNDSGIRKIIDAMKNNPGDENDGGSFEDDLKMFEMMIGKGSRSSGDAEDADDAETGSLMPKIEKISEKIHEEEIQDKTTILEMYEETIRPLVERDFDQWQALCKSKGRPAGEGAIHAFLSKVQFAFLSNDEIIALALRDISLKLCEAQWYEPLGEIFETKPYGGVFKSLSLVEYVCPSLIAELSSAGRIEELDLIVDFARALSARLKLTPHLFIIDTAERALRPVLMSLVKEKQRVPENMKKEWNKKLKASFQALSLFKLIHAYLGTFDTNMLGFDAEGNHLDNVVEAVIRESYDERRRSED